MINVSEKTYKDILTKVGAEKMRQIERESGVSEDAPPQEDFKDVALPDNIVETTGSINELQIQPSAIIGAENIAKSERDGVSVCDIEMSVFERNNLGKNFIFIEEKVVEEYKKQIIQLHIEISEYMKRSVEKAMKIGELLCEQKKRIRRGGFTQWVGKNMPFTVRTAQSYMRLFYYKDELQSKKITSLCDAYAFINGEATPDKVDTVSDSTDITNVGWSVVQTVSLDGSEPPKKHPKGFADKLYIDKELVNRMANGEYPFEGRKGKYLKIVVDISNSKKSMTPELLGDFLYTACDYLKSGGKLILHKKV
ncbi:MAG: DUF3102 domain-containing protein [Sedimentisphaerales bacterium]